MYQQHTCLPAKHIFAMSHVLGRLSTTSVHVQYRDIVNSLVCNQPKWPPLVSSALTITAHSTSCARMSTDSAGVFGCLICHSNCTWQVWLQPIHSRADQLCTVSVKRQAKQPIKDFRTRSSTKREENEKTTPVGTD